VGFCAIYDFFTLTHYLGQPASLSLAARPGNGERGVLATSITERQSLSALRCGIAAMSRIG
jgi:hypothetical protein